jgi:hypothetical protein
MPVLQGIDMVLKAAAEEFLAKAQVLHQRRIAQGDLQSDSRQSTARFGGRWFRFDLGFHLGLCRLCRRRGWRSWRRLRLCLINLVPVIAKNGRKVLIFLFAQGRRYYPISLSAPGRLLVQGHLEGLLGRRICHDIIFVFVITTRKN